MTKDEYNQMLMEIRRIVVIKVGSFPAHTIDGAKLTFVASNDDEAFSLGTELYGIIKQHYGIKVQFITWWNLEKAINGFDDGYTLTIGTNS